VNLKLLSFSIVFFAALYSNAQQSVSRIDTGVASYYALKFHGRKTANGDIFHNDSLTAAHKTLPFGTLVRVTNLRNNKSVIVRINDRGMHGKKRIIDLSQAAAKEINMLGSGLVKVKLEVLEK
jgi:rare lipoprotein A